MLISGKISNQLSGGAIWVVDPPKHRIQPTGGIRPIKRKCFYARTSAVNSALSRPAHQRVTQTVRQRCR